MSLAAFPHPNERHATPPLTKTAFPSTWECCFGRKSPEKQRVGSMVSFPNHPYRPSEWATNFENHPYRPSEWVSNFENIPYRPSEWVTNFESNPYRPSEWATNFESNPYRPSEWATNFENVPYRPSEWAYFSENTLADGSEAGFSRKTTKTIPAFRLRFIPARHATKSRLPGNAFHSSLPLYRRPIGV